MQYTSVIFTKVNGEEYPSIMKEWSVSAYPTFLLFVHGQKVVEIQGAMAHRLECAILAHKDVQTLSDEDEEEEEEEDAGVDVESESVIVDVEQVTQTKDSDSDEDDEEAMIKRLALNR